MIIIQLISENLMLIIDQIPISLHIFMINGKRKNAII